MKNIKIVAIFIIAIIACSCDKSYDEPNQLSDAEWVTSQQMADTMFQVALNDYISFVDLSQGTLTHRWTNSVLND